MTFAPMSLNPLAPNYVIELYLRAQAHEPIFRRILVDLADNEFEANLSRNSSLDDIFKYCVLVDGQKTRISDFRCGVSPPSAPDHYKSGLFKERELKGNEALVIIEHSNDTCRKIYQVLGKDKVVLIDKANYHQL